MRTADFPAVIEAKKQVLVHLAFYRSMMGDDLPDRKVSKKKRGAAMAPSCGALKKAKKAK